LKTSDPAPVDINNASVQQIAALPGLGILLANRVVNLREVRGGFHSFEEFCEALKLNPHTIERLRPLVTVSPPVQRSQRPDPSGRATLDINNASVQQISRLPDVGFTLARQAVSLREARGGFYSFEEFCEALDLEPHIVDQIRPLVSISPPVQRSERLDSPGRVIDY
jgi:DNA uptake protein ComE-like DNA-binding protein